MKRALIFKEKNLETLGITEGDKENHHVVLKGKK
jgi:hypothetical protein